MIVSTSQLIQAAQAGGYAIGAFNVYNMEGIKAVLAAAEDEHSPVILQLHPSALRYGGSPIDCTRHRSSTPEQGLGRRASRPQHVADRYRNGTTGRVQLGYGRWLPS